MTIHIYAEHLVNIRTLSIQASLSTVSNKATRATLSADGSALSLAHEGDVATIHLPIHVPGGHNDATLPIPPAPTKKLSFRVSLQDKSPSIGLLPNTSQESANVVPWSAPSMTADTVFACKACRIEIVSRGQIRVWKDLPSENWAEMMDFWHCHRPDVPHHHDHRVPIKGYSADSKLSIQSGVGMVDPTDFVLVPEDCMNLKKEPVFLAARSSIMESVGIQMSKINQRAFAKHAPAQEVSPSPSSESAEVYLLCSTCDTCIGHVHASTGGYKLRKAYLSVSTASGAPYTSYDSEQWLACHLLSSMESQGVRKFTIQSDRNNESALKAWIFTPDINVSSSADPDHRPFRALKLLWSDCTASTEQTSALNRQTLSEGELELHQSEMHLLRDLLAKSSTVLPESARKFQSWNVSLLRRFTDADVGPEEAGLEKAVLLPRTPDLHNKEAPSTLTT